MKYIISILFIVLTLTSCTKVNDPESILKKYIDYRFSTVQSKGTLLDMTAGELYVGIDSLSEEEFESFKTTSKMKMTGLKVLSKKCTETECYITFVIRYDQKNLPESFVKAQVKKIAKVINEEGSWKVADVNNVKTHYNNETPLDISAE